MPVHLEFIQSRVLSSKPCCDIWLLTVQALIRGVTVTLIGRFTAAFVVIAWYRRQPHASANG